MRIRRQNYHDIERIIEFDFVRATEAAALNSLPWLGRGEKEKADAAACDAMRGMFDLMNICGEVVIGEGIKDDAPGIFKGEQLGTWMPGSPPFDIALDPIDGTTNISKGAPNSISCIAAASPEEGVKVALRDIPSFYMMKLAYGPRVVRHMQTSGIDLIKLESPIEETLLVVAQALNKRVQDVVVTMLDRPRHKEMVARNSEGGRFVAADQRRRYRGGHGALPDRQRDRSLFWDRRIAGSGARRGGNQVPGRRHAMRDVAARREGAQESYRRRTRSRSRPRFFCRRPGQRQEHHFLRDGNQRQRVAPRRKIPGRHGDDVFDPDAGKEPDGAIHSGLARSAEQDHPAPLG